VVIFGCLKCIHHFIYLSNNSPNYHLMFLVSKYTEVNFIAILIIVLINKEIGRKVRVTENSSSGISQIELLSIFSDSVPNFFQFQCNFGRDWHHLYSQIIIVYVVITSLVHRFRFFLEANPFEMTICINYSEVRHSVCKIN